MKYVYTFFLMFFISVSISAQVGVNTTTPTSDLHVVGNMQITKELRVGGNTNTLGNPGTENQVLASGGTNQPTAWKDLKSAVPFGTLISTLQAATRTEDVAGGVFNTALYNSSTDSFFYDSQYVSYDSNNGQYTILKAGFYRLYATVYIRILDNNMASEGWTKSFIKKQLHL